MGTAGPAKQNKPESDWHLIAGIVINGIVIFIFMILDNLPDDDKEHFANSITPIMESPAESPMLTFRRDSDGDGVVDWDDRCPNEKGLSSRWGCPPASRLVEECERAAHETVEALLIFDPETVMAAGVTSTVEAAMTTNLTAKALAHLPEADEPTAVPIEVTCVVEARLVAVDDDFAIEPMDFEQQVVTADSDARWIWLVQPLRLGRDLKILLEVRAVLSDKNSRIHSKPFSRTVAISVEVDETTRLVDDWLESVEETVDIHVANDPLTAGEPDFLGVEVDFSGLDPLPVDPSQFGLVIDIDATTDSDVIHISPLSDTTVRFDNNGNPVTPPGLLDLFASPKANSDSTPIQIEANIKVTSSIGNKPFEGLETTVRKTVGLQIEVDETTRLVDDWLESVEETVDIRVVDDPLTAGDPTSLKVEVNFSDLNPLPVDPADFEVEVTIEADTDPDVIDFLNVDKFVVRFNAEGRPATPLWNASLLASPHKSGESIPINFITSIAVTSAIGNRQEIGSLNTELRKTVEVQIHPEPKSLWDQIRGIVTDPVFRWLTGSALLTAVFNWIRKSKTDDNTPPTRPNRTTDT